MRILELTVPEGYEWVTTRNLEDDKTLVAASGSPQGAGWGPVPVDVLTTDDAGRPRLPTDCPWLGNHLLIARHRARKVLEPLLGPFGEFLALVDEADDLDAFNALEVVDALDEERSSIWRFRSGRVMQIERYAFVDGVIPRRTVFRVPQFVRTMFFTEELADDVLALGLAGLRLDPVGDVDPA